MFWVPVICSLIQDLGAIASHQKTMSKARWHPQLASVVCTQCNANPFAKAWRISAQVNSYIKHLALGYPDKFTLWMLRLVVQSTQYTSHRFAVVVLHKLHFSAYAPCKINSVKTFKKKSTVVTKYSWLQQQNIRYISM